MTALEQVMNMKKEGRSEPEIVAALKAKNVPPMEISNAINQSKIKEAVTDDNPTEGMMPSIMGSAEQEERPGSSEEKSDESVYTPAPAPSPAPSQNQPPAQPQPPQSMQQQQYSPQEYSQQPQQQPQEQYYDPYSQQPQQGYAQQDPFSNFSQQQGYPQDAYSPQDTYGAQDGYGTQDAYSSGMSSTDTIIEVAEQVFQEKVKKLTQELKKLSEFRTIFEQKVENISHRLERMEKHFDKMQLDILGKVSEYGKGLNYMQKELRMVENSLEKFSEKHK